MFLVNEQKNTKAPRRQLNISLVAALSCFSVVFLKYHFARRY